MTPPCQSREETGRVMRTPLLNTKHSIRIGQWNVRTMFQLSKSNQICREMEKYNVNVLGISECRWTGQGRVRLDTGETILYSGGDTHQHGVALILNKLSEKALIEWEPVNNRIIRARFNSNQIKISVIQVYGPTNVADDDIKDEFFETLQAQINDVPKHDMLIVTGDFNAVVGQENDGIENIMGIHGCGTRSDNGQRLIDLCQENDLVIGGTLFPHKNIHKTTWISPDGRTKNQIDHILINKKWKGSLQDVRVFRGADIFSDHHLLVCKLKLKLKAIKKNGNNASRKYDVNKLKNPVKLNEFKIELRNRYQILSTIPDHNIEEKWEEIKDTYCSTAEKILGFKKNNRKEWLSDETWTKIEERKEAKKRKLQGNQNPEEIQRANEEYSNKDKEVKRAARKDKRKFLEDKANEAQEASNRGDLNTVYKITKQLCNKFRNNNVPVKDKNGIPLTSERQQAERWKEHFKEVLNRPEPTVPADPDINEETLDINVDPPTEAEVREAIKSLKSNKAAGVDAINAELLKADLAISTKILTAYFKEIWLKEVIPADWTKGIIIKLPKKGDPGDCNNWRGITLLSIPSKVLCKIILRRIDSAISDNLREEQAGFRSGKGCIDQIFSLRTIIEQSLEWNVPVFINFIDFSKAFDSIHRDSLWKIVRSYGIPDKLVRLIKTFYENYECCIALDNNKLSDNFNITTGVRQGCILSPILFLIIIDWVMRKSTNDANRGIPWGEGFNLDDLDFADDLALLSTKQEDLQTKTNNLVKFADQVGLKVNVKKTETMHTGADPVFPIYIEGEAVKSTKKFTYLGSVMSTDEGALADIKSRLAKARNAFSSLNNIWKSNKYSLDLKLKIYNSNVKPILMYGAETWRFVRIDFNKLNVFHTKSLRRICKIFWPNRISNVDLFQLTKSRSMEDEIKIKRWKWLGHVIRMENDKIPKVALQWHPVNGRRTRGRPKKTWRKTIADDLDNLDMDWEQMEERAQDRRDWRMFVSTALCSVRNEEH